MAKFYCPEDCRHGNIVICKENSKFADDTSFAKEDDLPVCPRYSKKPRVVKATK